VSARPKSGVRELLGAFPRPESGFKSMLRAVGVPLRVGRASQVASIVRDAPRLTAVEPVLKVGFERHNSRARAVKAFHADELDKLGRVASFENLTNFVGLKRSR
jgi:hypothetical protein